MIPFKTTFEQIANIPSIVNEMITSAVDYGFVEKISALARFDQGVYDLMFMWFTTYDQNERNEIITDLQMALSDYQDDSRIFKAPLIQKPINETNDYSDD